MIATENYENLGLTNLTICHPDEVPPETRFDLMWSNPPIRVGKVALHGIVTRWLNTLTPQGEAWFVIAKKLGGDSFQHWINQGNPGHFQATRVETSRGFRVLCVTRS
jgi:16S rRNA G1207 methylase RsmC